MNLTAQEFDLVNARACLQASADAYQRSTIRVTATDTNCLIVEDADCIVLAFRGSASIRNWITDAQFQRTTLVSGVDGTVSKIHKGFEWAFNSIFEQLLLALGGCSFASRQSGKPLFITGHSLGGALAILAALELQRNGFRIAQVYTFGQPRVGNGDFKQRYDAVLGRTTFRVVYQEDIVPRIPHLPAWHDPYRHVGNEMFISSLSPLNSSPFWLNPPIWRLLLSDAWGIYRAFTVAKFAGALDPVIDHHINNYRLALDAAVETAYTAIK